MLFVINAEKSLWLGFDKYFKLAITGMYYILDTDDLSVESVSYEELLNATKSGVEIENIRVDRDGIIYSGYNVCFKEWLVQSKQHSISCMGGKVVYDEDDNIFINNKKIRYQVVNGNGWVGIYINGLRGKYIPARGSVKCGLAYVYKCQNYYIAQLIVSTTVEFYAFVTTLIVDESGDIVDYLPDRHFYYIEKKVSLDDAFSTKYMVMHQRDRY